MIKHYRGDDGDRDFLRPVAEQLDGIPPERVIGSALGLTDPEEGDSRQVGFAGTPP